MTSCYEINLTINLPDGGRHARHLLNFYAGEMPGDLQAAAGDLCGGDPALQSRKFGQLALKRMEVWSSQSHSLKVFVLLSVCSDDETFVNQVFARYMECFPGYLKRASGVYLATADHLPEISLQPTDWEVVVRQG